jgi:hypothetical protein
MEIIDESWYSPRMKTIAALATIVVIGCSSLTAQDKSSQDSSNVTVEFVNPEKFKDFATSRLESEEDRKALMKEFRSNIQRVAGRYLPAGYRLELRFQDIDMAGEFEPQAGPDFQNVRVVKAIYTPSIVVEYKIADPKGNVVASGRQRETDLAFQQIATFRTDGRLFYETELVIDLLREITRSL